MMHNNRAEIQIREWGQYIVAGAEFANLRSADWYVVAASIYDLKLSGQVWVPLRQFVIHYSIVPRTTLAHTRFQPHESKVSEVSMTSLSCDPGINAVPFQWAATSKPPSPPFPILSCTKGELESARHYAPCLYSHACWESPCPPNDYSCKYIRRIIPPHKT